VVKLLLQHPRVDPSDGYDVAIRNAVINGNLCLVNLLLQDPRVDPRESRTTISTLKLASIRGHIAIVERLLQDSRIVPTEQDLNAAKECGHHAVVDRLQQYFKMVKV
jgi:hypothetical protein